MSEIKWEYYVTRVFNWFVEDVQISASRREAQEDVLGWSIPTQNYLILNGDEYFDADEDEQPAEFFTNAFAKDSRFFDKAARTVFRVTKETDRYRRRLERKRFEKWNDSALANEVERFARVYLRSFVPVWTRPDSFLEAEIARQLPEEAFRAVATPALLGPLAYRDEPLDLLGIAASGVTEKKLMRHLEQYAWMKAPIAMEETAFTQEEYVERLNHLASQNAQGRLRVASEAEERAERDFRDVVKKFALRGPLLRLCSALRTFIFLRTYSTEASDHLFFVARRTLLREAARRLNLESEAVVMLTEGEIVRALRGETLDLEGLVNQRRQGFAIVWENGRVQTFAGNEALALQKRFGAVAGRTSDVIADTKELIGRSGSTGVARGAVRIVRGSEEVGKFQPGEILVATMTTPDLVSAMERASAFVTDEGGVTCHAAILAREFGVPCVIGTGNATKVLHDGDEVEVDAMRGVVRILNRVV